MVDASMIKEHMEVVGSDGQKVGVVDKVEGSSVKLTKNDPTAGGQHHTFPVSWVADVQGSVKLNKSSQEARQQWQTA